MKAMASTSIPSLCRWLDIAGAKAAITQETRRTPSWQRGRQLQTPRLDFLPPALLGRADPDRETIDGKEHAIPEKDLPLVLPELDITAPDERWQTSAFESPRFVA
jgi:hypothetical protein